MDIGNLFKYLHYIFIIIQIIAFVNAIICISGYGELFIMETIGEAKIFERISKLCKENNTNITALCKEITGSSGNLSTWKKDNIRPYWLVSICQKLNVSADYILTGTPPSSNIDSLNQSEEKEFISVLQQLSQTDKEEIMDIMLIKLNDNEKQMFDCEFGKRLTDIMDYKNLTSIQITKLSNISKNNIGNYKKGQIPNALILLKLSQILGVSMEYLLSGKEISNLTSNEQKLVNCYRQTDDRGKRNILRQAESEISELESSDSKTG